MIVHLRKWLLIKTIVSLVLVLCLTQWLWRWIAYELAWVIFVLTKDYVDYQPVHLAWFILWLELVGVCYLFIHLYIRKDRKLTAIENRRGQQPAQTSSEG